VVLFYANNRQYQKKIFPDELRELNNDGIFYISKSASNKYSFEFRGFYGGDVSSRSLLGCDTV
jgi:hypothetical protein